MRPTRRKPAPRRCSLRAADREWLVGAGELAHRNLAQDAQPLAGVVVEAALRGGQDTVGVLDGVARLWFALALGQEMGRRVAFKVLIL